MWSRYQIVQHSAELGGQWQYREGTPWPCCRGTTITLIRRFRRAVYRKWDRRLSGEVEGNEWMEVIMRASENDSERKVKRKWKKDHPKKTEKVGWQGIWYFGFVDL